MAALEQNQRVLWFERPGILIFDPGYRDAEGAPLGDVHVYEHRESVPAAQLAELETKYGHHLTWDLRR